MNLKGMTIKDILNLDRDYLSGLSREGLAKVTSRLVSAANKRVRRMSKNPETMYSPALKKAMEGGKFSVEGKDKAQIRAEFGRLSRFLQAKTGSFKGFKKEKKRVQKLTGFKVDKNLSKKEKAEKEEDFNKKFWKKYRQIMELKPTLAQESGGSSQLISNLRAMSKKRDITDMDTDEMEETADKALSDLQKKQERKMKKPKDYFDWKSGKKN